MKWLIILCFLVSYVHAITCLDAVLTEQKNELSLFAYDDGAYLDSIFYKFGISDGEIVFKEKFTRDGDKITASWSKKDGDEVRTESHTIVYRKSESEVDGSAEKEMVVQKNQIGDTLSLNMMYYNLGEKISDYHMKSFLHGMRFEYIDSDGYQGNTEIFLQNDTLFEIHVGQDSGVATPDTSEYHIYVPDQTDSHKCYLWFRHDGIGSVTDIDGHEVQAGEFYKSYEFTIVENDSGFVIKRFRYHDGRIDEDYMIYSEKATTAIKTRAYGKVRRPKTKGYFDLKGRQVNKQLPYRVVF